MQQRVNDIFNYIVNKGLIISKFRGNDQAMRMMIQAGLPRSVITRVLSTSQNKRSSDWH
jgi:hypothetical protein